MKELFFFIQKNRWLLLAFAFICLTLFINLGSGGIYAAQEGRTALIVRNMLCSGNFLDMQLAYGIPYEKPIGHYWFCLPCAYFFHLAGEPLLTPAEWAVRLPSALSALAAIIFAALLANRIYGKRSAILTIVILGTMVNFDKLGRLAHIDMPLAAAYAGAMYFLYIGYFEKKQSNRWIYAFYALLGWGAILKGPLVILLAGLVVLAMMILSRNWKMPWEMRPVSGGLIFLAVALPWYIIENIRTSGAFYEEFILNQNIRRFTGIGSTYRNGERMPLWYYIPKLFQGALPWSIFSLLGIFHFHWLWKKQLRNATFFLLFWLLTGFLFFSLSALKRGDYLLPLYPALAILTARVIDYHCDRLPALSRHWLKIWGSLVALLSVAFLINSTGIIAKFGQMIIDDKVPFGGKRDGQSIVMISDFINHHWAVGILLFILIATGLFFLGKLLEKQKAYEAFFLTASLVVLLFVAYHGAIEPGTDQYKTIKQFAEKATKIIPATETVTFYDDFNTEMIFFINRPYNIELQKANRFVFTSPEAARHLTATDPKRWIIRLETIPDHQYPAVLLEMCK